MFKLLVIYISLLTCTPGQELYSRYGHTAIRVQDTEKHADFVFNYGTFTFNTDNFYWKFVKGETYYQLGIDPTSWFMEENRLEGRTIYEQPLNLTEEQTKAVTEALWKNFRPENRSYLYNFVFDNCATRPYYLLKNVLGDSIHSTYSEWEGVTYRKYIQRYTGKDSWADFAINMIFGPRADQPMTNEDRLFMPEALMFFMQDATLSDGTPLVKESPIEPFVIAPTPWYKTWYIGLVVFIIFMLTISLIDLRRDKWSWYVDLPFAIIYVLLFAIVIFLTFFSIHPLVGFNWRLFLFPLIHLCLRLIYIVR